MKLVVAGLAALACSTAHADRSFNTGDGGGTHDCATDPVVSINASAGTYKLTGTCDKVSVNGADSKVTVEAAKTIRVNGSANTVAIGAADAIRVNGSANKVTYKKGLSSKKPKVSSLGVGNKVTIAK